MPDIPDTVLPVAVTATASAQSADRGHPAVIRFYEPETDEPLAPAPYVRLRWQLHRRSNKTDPQIRVALPSGTDDRIGAILEFFTPQFAAQFAAQLTAVAEAAAATPVPASLADYEHPF